LSNSQLPITETHAILMHSPSLHLYRRINHFSNIPLLLFLSCHWSASWLLLSLSLSVLTAIFPGEHALASFIGAKDDGSSGDNWIYKTCMRMWMTLVSS